MSKEVLPGGGGAVYEDPATPDEGLSAETAQLIDIVEKIRTKRYAKEVNEAEGRVTIFDTKDGSRIMDTTIDDYTDMEKLTKTVEQGVPLDNEAVWRREMGGN